MRLLKMTGGLGNQMFIYALYLSMKQQGINVIIDLSDMVHYHAHYGYEMHKVFGLPNIEFKMNQKLKKVVEFLFFKTILERKQHGSLNPYFGKQLWPLVYYKGFYQNERYFSQCAELVRKAFTFDLKQANERSLQALKPLIMMLMQCQFTSDAATICTPNTLSFRDVCVPLRITNVPSTICCSMMPKPTFMCSQMEWTG